MYRANKNGDKLSPCLTPIIQSDFVPSGFRTLDLTVAYSTNHVYLHRPNAFGFWQTRLHLCYETLKRVSNFSELA